MIKKVFLDLDGVVADFVSAVLDLHSLTPEEVLPNMKGSYSIDKILNVSPTRFWKIIEEAPYFWEALEKTEEADQIFALLLKKFEPSQIYFLSAPSLSSDSHWGKAEWVRKHYPEYLNRLILTGHKHLLASRDAVLIDDSDKKVEAFRKAGGKAILFPRPWNSYYEFANLPLSLFSKEVNRVL